MTLQDKIVDIVMGHGLSGTPHNIQYAAQHVADFIREAIQKPNLCGDVDTWLVRAMIGKPSSGPLAVVSGDKRIEYPNDPMMEVFIRVFASEREQGATPNLSIQVAEQAALAFSKLGPLVSGTEKPWDGETV